MSPYFACQRHPNLYRFSVKLFKIYSWTRWAFRIPAAVFMWRRYCIYLDSVPSLPVYLYKCEEDLQLGQSLFESSFRFLDEKSPTWGKRARHLFKRVLICDKVDVVAYLPEQKCCAVNPWIIARARQNAKRPLHHSEMARFIVYAVCTAFLWERHAAFLSKQDRKILSNKAQSA